MATVPAVTNPVAAVPVAAAATPTAASPAPTATNGQSAATPAGQVRTNILNTDNKYMKDPLGTRFYEGGVNFRAKLIGQELVSEARGDQMCRESMIRLKAQIKVSGEHKAKIFINVDINGLRIGDATTGVILHTHNVSQISFISRDATDNRAFGYIIAETEDKHRFFAIKTERPADNLVLTMRDLFQFVYELKKNQIDQQKSGTAQSAGATPAQQAHAAGAAQPVYQVPANNAPVNTQAQVQQPQLLIENSDLQNITDNIKTVESEFGNLVDTNPPAQQQQPANSDPFGGDNFGGGDLISTKPVPDPNVPASEDPDKYSSLASGIMNMFPAQPPPQPAPTGMMGGQQAGMGGGFGMGVPAQGGFPQQQPPAAHMGGFPQQQPPAAQMGGFPQQQPPAAQMGGFPQQQPMVQQQQQPMFQQQPVAGLAQQQPQQGMMPQQQGQMMGGQQGMMRMPQAGAQPGMMGAQPGMMGMAQQPPQQGMMGMPAGGQAGMMNMGGTGMNQPNPFGAQQQQQPFGGMGQMQPQQQQQPNTANPFNGAQDPFSVFDTK